MNEFQLKKKMLKDRVKFHRKMKKDEYLIAEQNKELEYVSNLLTKYLNGDESVSREVNRLHDKAMNIAMEESLRI